MFDVDLCEAKRVSLVSFHGDVTEADFAALDALARQAVYRGGVHSIYDFTRVKVNALFTTYVADRGERPQTFKGFERFYVVPQDVQVMRRMVRMFIDFQKAQGEHPPILVDTLDEALQKLAVERSAFHRFTSGP